MTEEMLSQEEIDALLSGGLPSDSSSEQSEPPKDNTTDSNNEDLEKIRELFETILSTSSTVMGTLLNSDCLFDLQNIKRINQEELSNILGTSNFAFNKITFGNSLKGGFHFLIKKEDIGIIGDMMMGGEGTQPPDEIDEIFLSAIDEAFNQMMGSSANSATGLIGDTVEISPGKCNITTLKGHEENFDGNPVLIDIKFTLGELIDSNCYILITENDYKELINSLQKNKEKETKEETTPPLQPQETNISPPPVEQKEVPPAPQMEAQPAPPQQQPIPNQAPSTTPNQTPPPQFQQPIYQQPQMGPQAIGNTGVIGPQPQIRPAQFTQISPQQTNNLPNNIDLLMDVPLQITVELGRKKMKIREILELGAGSVIELDKLAGEPVDVLVNNKLIAKGEVVVIDENFGIRITSIVSTTERLANMMDM